MLFLIKIPSERKEELLEKSIIVAAHPDDEMLWFSSILDRVDKIVVCFVTSQSRPEWGPARRASMLRYPLPNLVSLELEQADTLGLAADWENPVLTKFGIAMPKRPDLNKRYQANYHALRQHLKQQLTGTANVFTHNPWGEYGHEEHVQVYRVIKDLQQELHFKLWYSNYCSNRSYPLMLRQTANFKSASLTLKTDLNLARKIKKIYQDENCWTWYPDWEGFSEESFACESVNESLKVSRPGDISSLNFIRLNDPIKKQSVLRKVLSFSFRRESGFL